MGVGILDQIERQRAILARERRARQHELDHAKVLREVLALAEALPRQVSHREESRTPEAVALWRRLVATGHS